MKTILQQQQEKSELLNKINSKLLSQIVILQWQLQQYNN